MQFDLLRTWRQWCAARAEAHGASRRHFRFLDVMMSGAIVAISGVAGVLSLIDPHTQTIVGALNVIGASVGAMAGVFKFGERKRQHDFFEVEYEHVANMIETEMATMDTDPTYADVDEFVKAYRATVDRLDARAPDIPAWIEK